jgi:hypothetical protein
LKRQGAKAPSVEDRKALEALNDLLGIDVLADLKKRNAADAFDGDATRGSRLTVLGGLIGGGIGGGPGMMIGGAAGAYADRASPMLLRDILDAQKGPLIRPPDVTPAQMLDTYKKDFINRGRVGYGLKAAQGTAVMSDEAEKKREAMRRRQREEK